MSVLMVLDSRRGGVYSKERGKTKLKIQKASLNFTAANNLSSECPVTDPFGLTLQCPYHRFESGYSEFSEGEQLQWLTSCRPAL